MRRTHWLGLSAVILAFAGTAGLAQIKELTLPEMVADTDDAVFGEIVGSHVFRVDHPTDGAELYFTTLTIEGSSLVDSTPLTVDVTFMGGFIDEENGVWNSEAPSADDVKIGNRVVAFYKWQDNMGGDVAANALYAMHGGLYRTVAGPRGTMVLGRGNGYAVSKNVKLADLDKAITSLKIDPDQQGGK